MKPLFCAIFLLLLVTTYAAAQQAVFTLPDGQSGKPYSAEVETVLRDKYGWTIGNNVGPVPVQWSFVSGELPKGLAVAPFGSIIGTPEETRERPYQFRLRAAEQKGTNALVLQFELSVRSEGLRLVSASMTGENLGLIRYNSSKNSAVTARAENDAAPAESTNPSTSNGGNVPTLSWNSAEPPHQTFGEAEKTLEVKIDDQSRKLCLLNVTVRGPNEETIVDRKIKVDYNKEVQSFKIPLAKGENNLHISAWLKKPEKDCTEATPLSALTAVTSSLATTIDCNRGDCGNGFKTSKKSEDPSPFSSLNTRALIGIEQSGASSAASEHTPFIDFFFNTPFGRKKTEGNSRFSMWGDVRLTSTAQQITGFVSSTANVAGAVKDNQINDIATSFDFKFGPEFQFNPNSRNRMSFIAGAGAISPLTEPTNAAPIFKVPTDTTNSQTANFLRDYPEAGGAKYIAFVRPERDRFLRQYFVGLRFKSYHYDENDKLEPRFPSMFDITFGQNAAVTGGRLHKFVMGFDGSYQLPLKTGLYVFGSANLKFGGDKSIKTPYVLEPAESSVTLTSSGVVTTTRQLNRDSYRIGFGVDLVELFKDKSADKKAPQ